MIPKIILCCLPSFLFHLTPQRGKISISLGSGNIMISYYIFGLLYTLESSPGHLYLLFIYLWLCWVFVSVRGLSLVAASGGHSSSRCAGLSLSRPLLFPSTGSRRAGSVIVAHGPSCSAACGIFPDQGSNLCCLHWQADSQPLRQQGSPLYLLMIKALQCCSQFKTYFVFLQKDALARLCVRIRKDPVIEGTLSVLGLCL